MQSIDMLKLHFDAILAGPEADMCRRLMGASMLDFAIGDLCLMITSSGVHVLSIADVGVVVVLLRVEETL